MRACAVLLVFAACMSASARQDDGALGVIVSPHNARPAVVEPGQTFEAVLETEAELVLRQGEIKLPLDVRWRSLPGGKASGWCGLPAKVPPGAYDLEATGGSVADRNLRAVYVLEALPETYAVAHIADPCLGLNAGNRPSQEVFRDLVAAANSSGAALIVITGDLVEQPDRDRLKAFLDILDNATVPTYVCPGGAQEWRPLYEAYLGPLTFTFVFGLDAYLAFRTENGLANPTAGAQDSLLEVCRGRIKPARWSIGVSQRYQQAMPMRSQLVLFVDDPLDCLIAGQTTEADKEKKYGIPWGRTALIETPPAADGAFRLIDVTAQGVEPRPPVLNAVPLE
jgi:hypothetical protein